MSRAPARPADPAIAAVRRFNRFYTRTIGVLGDAHLDGPFSLTEVRVLYELAHRATATAGAIAADLGLDAGYLSRIVRGFTAQGLVRKRPSPDDARESLLELTAKGKRTFATLDAQADDATGALLARLPAATRDRLVDAMRTIRDALGDAEGRAPAFVLRDPYPGDLGWILERHGALYAREHAWHAEFEALVAEVIAQFLRGHDPRRERCWIAEADGMRAGSVLVMRQSAEVAKLRLLLVEPSARGLGIGGALVREALRFAKRAGYRRMTLWTNSELRSARKIYEAEGFVLVDEAPHDAFGHASMGQTWERDL